MGAREIHLLHLGKPLTAQRLGRRWRIDYDGRHAEALFATDALGELGVPGNVAQLALSILALEAGGEPDGASAVPAAEGPSSIAARPSSEPE